MTKDVKDGNLDNEYRHLDRRQLLSGLVAAGLAPLLSMSQQLAAAETGQTRTPPRKRVLGKNDLKYLGMMRVPERGTDMGFSYGSLTARKIGRTVHLIMGGSVVSGDPIYEFADTGDYHTDVSRAPRMPLIRNWGDIYGTARRTWLPDGREKAGYPRYPGGLQWNEATRLLYWVYYDTYKVSGDEDWCLGASRLDAAGPVAFGPWRPAGGGKKGPWRCVRIAQHPVSGELLCGSGLMSGNISSPWGPDLWGGAFPTETTRAGFGAPDLPVSKYLTYYSMIGKIRATDGSFTGPVRSCRRPGDYIYEPFAGFGSATEIDPQKNGGVGSWTQLDNAGGVVWIDLPDAHGVLFAGRLAAGHVWYRNKGLGAERCSHGIASPVDVTGPVSTAAYPTLFFFDPADLDAVRAGRREDYTVDPVAVVNAETAFGVQTSPLEVLGTAKSLSGVHFDSETRRLYVAAPQADQSLPGVLNPLIHVFQVG